jgi:lipopolysaccharide export system protein LptA
VFRFTLRVLLHIGLACGLAAPAVYAAAPLSLGASNEPIHIEADRMESDQRRETVLFAGKVEATQGNLVIQADEMTVTYRKTAPDAGEPAAAATGKSVDKLRANGNIKIIKEDWLASGDHLDFETEGRKIVLTGNTKVWQGNNTVTGDQVILYLDEGKSIVEDQGKSSGGRVKAFFYPESEKTENDAE